MMRGLRLCVFFLVGLALGGGAVSAFAVASDYGRSMRLNAPESSRARFTGAPIYDWADAPDGWGKMKDINKINVGGKAFDVTGGRLFSPQTLAKSAVSFARFGGPWWVAFMAAPFVWDEVQGWLKDQTPPPAECPAGVNCEAYWQHTMPSPDQCKNGSNTKCTYSELVSMIDQAYSGWTFVRSGIVSGCGTPTGACQIERVYQSGAYIRRPSLVRHASAYVAPDPIYAPATDQELEDAIYVELVARGMGSELARRLIEAGYNPRVDGIEIDGPSSIPGGSTTTTTTGPAGQTTTTTNTTHNITYNTNTTNNTSTVTITTTNVSTTVAPDGTTTETTTESPAEDGETPPPEEPTPFCEQYPDASACQPLGDTQEEELDEETVNVPWSQEGGAGGTCPAPIQISVLGTQHAIQWTPICQVASGIRPIVIGLAWLSAALWLFLMARARA